jgi:hypothetical protein
MLVGGLRAEVSFNGWPLLKRDDQDRRTADRKVNPFVLEGENRLVVALGALPADPAPTVSPVFELVFSRGPHGESRDDDVTLAHYKWTPDESLPLDDEHLTPVFEHTARFKTAYGSWAWESARPYANEDRDDVLAVVRTIHAALASKNLAGANAMLSMKHHELERCLSLPTGQLVADQLTLWSGYVAHADFRLDPFDPTKLVLESAAGGRLVSIRHTDGAPPIEGTAGGDFFGLDLVVSRIGGGYQIVR